MGIRSTGWEVVCNDCGQVVGPFDLREEAEAAIIALGWAWRLPFEMSCPACAEKQKDKTP